MQHLDLETEWAYIPISCCRNAIVGTFSPASQKSSPGCMWHQTLCKKPIIHQVTDMLTTSKNVLFPGHNHLLTTGTDYPTLWLSIEHLRVKGHQYWWLADLEIGHFRSSKHGGYLVDSFFFFFFFFAQRMYVTSKLVQVVQLESSPYTT